MKSRATTSGVKGREYEGTEKFSWNDSPVIFELPKSETNIKPDITDDITPTKLGKRRSAATSRATRQDLVG